MFQRINQWPSIIGLVVAALATWRITHMLLAEYGPWYIFARLRMLAGDGPIGKILDCFYCLSVWVALAFAPLLARGWLDGALVWLALSGAAILLERITADRTLPTALWREDDSSDPP